MTRRSARVLLLTVLAALLPLGCPSTRPSSGIHMDGPRRPPPKPGESITHTQMCSCTRCEPESCCHELEQDQPETNPECADGYDFSKCEMAVSSCGANCYQHRWRTHVETGCEASRPDACCHDQADF